MTNLVLGRTVKKDIIEEVRTYKYIGPGMNRLRKAKEYSHQQSINEPQKKHTYSVPYLPSHTIPRLQKNFNLLKAR